MPIDAPDAAQVEAVSRQVLEAHRDQLQHQHAVLPQEAQAGTVDVVTVWLPLVMSIVQQILAQLHKSSTAKP